jgi:hypothetical protein
MKRGKDSREARALVHTGGAKTSGLRDERRVGKSEECRRGGRSLSSAWHRKCSSLCNCDCHVLNQQAATPKQEQQKQEPTPPKMRRVWRSKSNFQP